MALLIDALDKADKERRALSLALEEESSGKANYPEQNGLSADDSLVSSRSDSGLSANSSDPAPSSAPSSASPYSTRPPPTPFSATSSAHNKLGNPASSSVGRKTGFPLSMVLVGLILLCVGMAALYFVFSSPSGLVVLTPRHAPPVASSPPPSSSLTARSQSSAMINPASPTEGINPAESQIPRPTPTPAASDPAHVGFSQDSAFGASKIQRQIPENALQSPYPIRINAGSAEITKAQSIVANPKLDSVRTLMESRQYARAADETLALLRTEPHQVEALQNMAIIAYNLGYADEAIVWLRRVLSVSPSHPFALNLLAVLTTDGDTSHFALAQSNNTAPSPDNEHAQAQAHFVVGNRLAAQGQWAEAQHQFFQAWNSHSDHPDYAYNLAVSLDQLGQAPLARQFYQRALDNLKLSGALSAHFSSAVVQERLAALSANPTQR